MKRSLVLGLPLVLAAAGCPAPFYAALFADSPPDAGGAGGAGVVRVHEGLGFDGVRVDAAVPDAMQDGMEVVKDGGLGDALTEADVGMVDAAAEAAPSDAASVPDGSCIGWEPTGCATDVLLHALCETGSPLNPYCDGCVQAVAEHDATCVCSGWTSTCITLVHVYCPGACS